MSTEKSSDTTGNRSRDRPTALVVSTWRLSASVLIPVFIHNVARPFPLVQCGVNGVYGDLLGRWHFRSYSVHRHSG
jgi:hypothetical protein